MDKTKNECDNCKLFDTEECSYALFEGKCINKCPKTCSNVKKVG
jgi:hypothetical protein